MGSLGKSLFTQVSKARTDPGRGGNGGGGEAGGSGRGEGGGDGSDDFVVQELVALSSAHVLARAMALCVLGRCANTPVTANTALGARAMGANLTVLTDMSVCLPNRTVCPYL